MYSLHLERTISASHYLKYYKGKCSNLHGHSFKVTVDIETPAIIECSGVSSTGMVLDFGQLKALIDAFDHKCINEVINSEEIKPKWIKNLVGSKPTTPNKVYEDLVDSCLNQPTAERLAKYFAKEINNHCCIGATIRVTVLEEAGQWAGYTMTVKGEV